MNTQTEKHWLQSALEDNGHQTRSYSGRTMSGRECLAITLDGDIDLFVLGAKMGEYAPGGADDTPRSRTDSMGRGMIIYWPGVPYFNEDEDEDAQ